MTFALLPTDNNGTMWTNISSMKAVMMMVERRTAKSPMAYSWVPTAQRCLHSKKPRRPNREEQSRHGCEQTKTQNGKIRDSQCENGRELERRGQ